MASSSPYHHPRHRRRLVHGRVQVQVQVQIQVQAQVEEVQVTELEKVNWGRWTIKWSWSGPINPGQGCAVQVCKECNLYNVNGWVDGMRLADSGFILDFWKG